MSEPTYGKAAGGVARAKSLSDSRRSEIAKKAAEARWEPARAAVCGSPDHPLTIGEVQIECYVLEDGTRVMSQGSFLKALGRSRTVRRTQSDSGLPPIVQGKALQPFLPEGLAERAQPIPFVANGKRGLGYNAELLPDVCDAFLAARAAGALPQNQWHIADQAEILVRGLARVGIIALVDEATGYQEVRARDALAKILEAYVAKELQPWVRTFPDDYYRELFRLRGLDYPRATVQRPPYFGILTNDIVYKRLAPGVLEELKRETPRDAKGRHTKRLHQRLTPDVGHPRLREHLASVVTIMKLSDAWTDFQVRLDRIHPRYNETMALPYPEEPDAGTGL